MSTLRQTFLKYHRIILCTLLAFIGLFLRFKTLANRNIHQDEEYQFLLSSEQALNFLNIFSRNYYGDFSCFPGDYILNYPFIRIFGLSKWGLAIPHILATVLGFYLLYLICSRYYKTTAGYLVAFSVVVFNSNLIYHSFEFRPYAVLPVMALATFYLTGTLFSKFDRLTNAQKILLTAFYIYLASFHVFAILFFVLSAAFFLADARSFKNVDKGLLTYVAGIFVVSSLIWLWYSSLNLGLGGKQDLFTLFDRMNVFEYIPNPLVNPVGFLKSIVGNLVGQKKLYPLLLGMVSLFLPRNRDRWQQWGFFLIFMVIGIQLIFLVCLLKNYWFLQRQFVWVMPLFAFFLGWCWDSLEMCLGRRYVK